MKVLVITTGFLESTLSLAKTISNKGIDVEVLCTNSKTRRNLNVINFSKIKSLKTWITKEDLRTIVNDDFYRFLSTFKINFHFKKGNSKNPIGFIRDAIKLIKYIKTQRADIIHIVEGSLFLGIVASMLPKNKIVFSLHEVTNYHGVTPLRQKILLNFIVRNSLPVIVHSEISKNRFIDYANSKNRSGSNPVYLIYFGLFEVYNFFNSQKVDFDFSFDISKSKVLLFFGRITPSKGLKVLLSAFKLLENEYENIHLIVAGNGDIDYDITGIKNLSIINRPISNEEIACLMKLSYAVICPYLSASQSGIPMTSYLYGKPIIATSVGAFSEVIIDKKTGILISPNDINSLKNAIVTMISDQQLYKNMISEIEALYSKDRFDWDIIAEQTIAVYSNAIAKQHS